MEKNEERIIKVTNRFGGSIGYTIKDLNNLQRIFSPGETKEVSVEEMKKLSWQAGGMSLIKDYLIIEDKEALYEILNEVEPEYFYTEEDIKDLLLNKSLDALKDCLDFAPEGTKDLVKKLAVELPLNDITKRDAILKMTGFNVTNAIAINEATKEENTEPDSKVRRLNEKVENKETKPTGRRVALDANKYNVVNRK